MFLPKNKLQNKHAHKLTLKSTLRACRLVMLAVPLWAASVTNVYAESWKVNLQEADIKAFVNEVAAITNKNFILDPRINGNVTVISNRAMNKNEIYELFLSVMQVNGVAAVNKDGMVQLIPNNVAKQSGVPIDLTGRSSGEQMITRVVYLTNTPASEILSVIRPMMPQTAHAAAVPSVNALVLSDRADSLNQLVMLIRDLDGNVNDSVSIINLKHTDAERMMEMINSLTGVASSNQAATSNQLNVIADPYSDRLIVKGNPEQMAKIQAMVNRLDTIPSKRLSGMRVFRLNYASAPHVADMLRALIVGQSINSKGATTSVSTASLSENSTTTANNNQNNNATTAVSNTNLTNSNSTSGWRENFSIIADETQNAVVVNASNELMIEIEDAIKQLDNRRAQVLIQAAIVEISGDDAKQLGVQWALGNANGGYGGVSFSNSGVSLGSLAAAYASGSYSSAASSIAGALLGLGDYSEDNNGNARFYGAILQALNEITSANLLSMPSILTLDNEEASILVGQNVPFVTGSYTTGTDSTNPFQTIDRQDVGIHLNVIPHIGNDGTVRLEISQEVSSVVPGTTTNANGVITNKSLINTTILAEDQQTIALGGLMRENSTTSKQKVPGVGDIPVLGRLFRSDSNSVEKSNLIIFLQPTVLRDGGAVASVTQRSFNQIQTMQLVIDANGTIKKIPLSGLNNGQPANTLDSNYQLMPLDPFAPHSTPLPNQIPGNTPAGFIKINE